LPTTPDLGDDLTNLLLETGFTAPLIRTFLFDRPTTNDQRPTTNDEAINPQPPTPNPQPLAAELPLLPWPALRPLLIGRLDATELVRCDELAAEPEVELCSVALVAQAQAG
jgi:hypothetical protein